jgi:universal stress protein A
MMRAWRKICCPVDFSEESRRTALHSQELAWAFGGEVTLLHVWDVPSVTTSPDAAVAAPALFESAAPELRERLAGWARELGPEVKAVVVAGSAAESIARFATEGGFDVIVMGTHGRSGVRHVLMGSVAEKVIRKAEVPVVVIRHP